MTSYAEASSTRQLVGKQRKKRQVAKKRLCATLTKGHVRITGSSIPSDRLILTWFSQNAIVSDVNEKSDMARVSVERG